MAQLWNGHGPRRASEERFAMPRANQHWVEELDFEIAEWTHDGVRLVEVLGRVHLLEDGSPSLRGRQEDATGRTPYAPPRRSGAARVATQAPVSVRQRGASSAAYSDSRPLRLPRRRTLAGEPR